MSTTVRKAAPRPAKPVARYRRGKAPKGFAELPSDSESEDARLEDTQDGGDVPITGEDVGDEEEEDLPVKIVPKGQVMKTMNIALKDVDISEEGKVIVAGREESGRTLLEDGPKEDSESEEDNKQHISAAVAESESSEYDSEDEDEEEQQQNIFRPVFIPKRARVTVLEREKEAADSEEAIKKKEVEAEERRKQSHDMVADSIRRELAEREKEKEQPDVDEKDGEDPTAEFEAWRMRELARIKRDKEDQLRRDEEREELERRRAMPEDQRLKEDLERAQKSREAKPKGQQKFLQKYWHKGAFHQDEEILKRHDYTQATESTTDVSLLPKVMQVRDFGKRSRTKYTHLVDQDTTAGNGGFGGASIKGGKSGDFGNGCFSCGGPHLKKDCPQNTGSPLVTGANSSVGGNTSRQWGSDKNRRPESDRSWRDRDHEGGREDVKQRSPDVRDRSQDYRYDRGRDRDRDRDRDKAKAKDGAGYGDELRSRDYDGGPGSWRRSRSPSPHRKDQYGQMERRDRRHPRDRSAEGDRGEGKRRRMD